MVQTVGLALATDLVKEEDHPKVVGLMYVMLLLGMVVSALIFGALLAEYTPGRLIQVIQGTAVVTVALNLTAMWKQEARNRGLAMQMATAPQVRFRDAWGRLIALPGTMRLLVVIGLGTFGFGMADVLLEPYGGQALGFSVAETTRLTALFAGGTLMGFGIASRALSVGGAPERLAIFGAMVGLPGFAAIIMSSAYGGAFVFCTGTLAIGLGAGLFGHGTLTATIRNAPKGQIGLALGAWGAVQATCAGIGVVLAGIVRDILVSTSDSAGLQISTPYNVVFTIEMAFLVVAILIAIPLVIRRDAEKTSRRRATAHSKPVEAS
jgi:BCD family chlorophyll transporter-like MFS transporter